MPTLFEELGLEPTENLRLKFLKEEFRKRKKQPEAWTKTKYRPYANFRTKKKVEVVEAASGKKVAVVEAASS